MTPEREKEIRGCGCCHEVELLAEIDRLRDVLESTNENKFEYFVRSEIEKQQLREELAVAEK